MCLRVDDDLQRFGLSSAEGLAGIEDTVELEAMCDQQPGSLLRDPTAV
jgi:hypothetical protein